LRELKWGDVLVGAGEMADRMFVNSPKTEHHEGRGRRLVPIVPELMALLLEAHQKAEEGDVHVLPRLRRVTTVATTARKIIERTGLTPWPRTFQNLRASCETDWANRFPIHVLARGRVTRRAWPPSTT
jgi:hypothetical protein